jgi:hypothetical protein
MLIWFVSSLVLYGAWHVWARLGLMAAGSDAPAWARGAPGLVLFVFKNRERLRFGGPMFTAGVLACLSCLGSAWGLFHGFR